MLLWIFALLYHVFQFIWIWEIILHYNFSGFLVNNQSRWQQNKFAVIRLHFLKTLTKIVYS